MKHVFHPPSHIGLQHACDFLLNHVGKGCFQSQQLQQQQQLKLFPLPTSLKNFGACRFQSNVHLFLFLNSFAAAAVLHRHNFGNDWILDDYEIKTCLLVKTFPFYVKICFWLCPVWFSLTWLKESACHHCDYHFLSKQVW